MAAINLVKSIVTPVAVGAVDEVLERMDNKEGRTGYSRWSSILRVVAVAAGHALTLMGPGRIYQEVGEGVAIAATPLLVKDLAVTLVQAQGGSPSYFAPRRIVRSGAKTLEDLTPERTIKIGV